jgi:serine/threonine-protein kinase ULK/ATG1
MHRDLKPDNIFFSNGVVKLGDFGFCKSLEKANMTKTMLGSPIYMAPEILRG